MGLLDGDIQAAIYQGFKGKLLTGVLRRYEPAESGALDDRGDPLDLGPVDYPIEGFTDQYSAFTRAQAGIPDSDLKVCILAGSQPALTPKADDLVMFTRGVAVEWYQLRGGKGGVRTDPAKALWECQSVAVQAPRDD